MKKPYLSRPLLVHYLVTFALLSSCSGTGSDESSNAKNQAPSAPLIQISPDDPKTTDVLAVQIIEPAVDVNGDSFTYEYEWSLDGEIQSALTADTVPQTATKKKQKWEVRVFAFDGKERSAAATAVTRIVNSAPTVSVSIDPENPNSSQDLRAQVVVQDADDEPVEITYTWNVGSAVSTRTSEVIPSSDTAFDQVWKVIVTGSDGEEDSSPAEASVKIGNAAPSVDGVVIEPAMPTSADQLYARVEGLVDRDGDNISLSYEWFIDGTAVTTNVSERLAPGTATRGQSVAVSVTPNDGYSDGETVTSTSIVIANAPPQVSRISISPAVGTVDTIFSCDTSAIVDYDRDSLTYNFVWLVNDSQVATSESLAVPLFERGDQLACEVTVSDGTVTVGPVRSSIVIVQNSAPSLASVTIGPNDPKELDVIRATLGTATDPENDNVEFRYAWRVNGQQVTTSTTIDGTLFERGDQITLSVTPFDGRDVGTAVLSNTLIVQNSPPSIAQVNLRPDPAGTNDDLTADIVGYADPDTSDSRQFEFAWTVNGSPVSLTVGVMPSSFYVRGSTVTVTVTPSDRTSSGQPVTSAPLVISNTLPETPGVTVFPSPASERDDLFCQISSASQDADLDPVSYTYAWLVDGNATTHTSSIVRSEFTGPGELWSCQVTPSDGYGNGSPGTFDSYVSATCDSIEFDGAGDFISIDTSPQVNYGTEATVEAWVNWQGNPSPDFSEILFTHRPQIASLELGIIGTDSQPCACPGRSAGQLYFRWGNSCGTDTCLTAGTPLNANRWLHVAAVYNAGSVTLFIDGSAVDTTTSAAAIQSIVGTSSAAIAGLGDGSSSFFGGQIAEIRVSTSALYLSDFIPASRLANESTSIFHTRFTEGGGQEIADLSQTHGPSRLTGGNWIPDGPECGFDVGNIASQYASALCRFRSRCEPVFYPYLSTDEAACVAERTTNFIALYGAFVPMLDQGRMRFEETVFDGCIDGLDNVSCTRGLDAAQCDFFVGEQLPGQPCGVSDECVSDAYCPVGAQFGTCAACTPRTLDGADCSNTACRDGSRCLTVGTSELCISFRADVGQSCGTVATGLCRGRLQCVGSTTRSCREPAALGQTCDDQQVNAPACNIYLSEVCDNSRCVAANWVTVGDSCVGPNECDVNSTCNTNTRVCDALPVAGQPCLQGRCSPDHYCDSSQICRADVPVGSACTATSECQPSKYCVNNVCQDFVWTQCN
ncbi:MAG: LamG-like jellyroll fold domain-containing protein [Myxococcota bacterium]|nr:LamG-like jellyroll fold domain-containing protein [Myxococcota bacterium]